MTRCQFCHQGLNSNYIRVGANESWKKVGLYCISCDIYYSPNLTKQYTVMQKQYTNQTGPVGVESMRYMGSVTFIYLFDMTTWSNGCMIYDKSGGRMNPFW